MIVIASANEPLSATVYISYNIIRIAEKLTYVHQQ